MTPAARLVRLLAPPFDRTPHSPGYIKGYVPGVRENGGQYTHAALWAARALAETGHADRAAERLKWISPVSRSSTREDADLYQVEPYVLAADVYAERAARGTRRMDVVHRLLRLDASHRDRIAVRHFARSEAARW